MIDHLEKLNDLIHEVQGYLCLPMFLDIVKLSLASTVALAEAELVIVSQNPATHPSSKV